MKKIIIFCFLCLCMSTVANAAWFLSFRYEPLTTIDWHWNGGQDWVYEKTNIQTGVSFVSLLPTPNKLKVSVRQYLDMDTDIGPIGVTGEVIVNSDSVLKVGYKYKYRWYSGSGGDYGYATGTSLSHRLYVLMDVPLFGGK